MTVELGFLGTLLLPVFVKDLQLSLTAGSVSDLTTQRYSSAT